MYKLMMYENEALIFYHEMLFDIREELNIMLDGRRYAYVYISILLC